MAPREFEVIRHKSENLQAMIMTDSETDDETLYSEARVGKRRLPDAITDMFKCIDSCACLKSLDAWIASIVMALVLMFAIGTVLFQASALLSDFASAGTIYGIRCTRLINDATYGITLFLVCLFWHTLCFRNHSVREIWKAEANLIGSVMAGGFIPKPAAASMGLLLFVNGNLLNNDVVLGDAVFEDMGSKFDSCVANSLEVDRFPAERWFQRLSREPPSGCYMVDNVLPEYPWLGGLALSRNPFVSVPQDVGASAADIPGLMHPVVDGVLRTDLYCTYYCSAFASVALSDVVTSIGEITAGAAVVAKVSDWVTTRFGWHLVTDTTSARQLVRAMMGVDLPEDCRKDHVADDAVERLQNVHIHRPGSPLGCAVQLLMVLLISRHFSPRVSINGRFTVDYYTTFLMLMASLYALMLRFWSPYNGRSIIFTKKLWTEGHDYFLEYNPHHKAFEEVRFNLYDWLHIPSQERKRLLLHYCRRVTEGRLRGTYNDKGWIPELEKAVEPENMAETNHDSTMTDTLVRMLGKIRKCVGYAVCPWRLSMCHVSEEDDPYQTRKLTVITTCTIFISKVVEDWKVDKLGEPVCDQKNHRLVIDELVKGTVMSMGKQPNTAVVEFTEEGREPGDVIALFLGAGDVIEFDEDGKSVKNTPVPCTGERDGKPVWTFEVPVDALRESSPEWAFTRKLFGEKSMQHRLGHTT